MKAILFLDRDGTIIEEPADHQIDSVAKFKLLPGVIPALLALKTAGYRFVMVTNQDGLGSARYPQKSFDEIQTLLLGILESQSIEFDDILICPHFAEDRCLCRKPGIGLVRAYLASPDWDRARSMVIGDRDTDLELAKNMGISGVKVNRPWSEISQDILSKARVGECVRNTRETQIKARVRLEGAGISKVSTGIGFFDHMLEQVSKHGGFDLELSVKGDAHIDDHHIVEDSALALGSALKQALGDKSGIERFAFQLPMDDASATVLVDLSGRAFCKFEGRFDREKVGELSTEMVPHFFRSFADGLQANIHVKVEGENTHHRVESSFKALGRALRQAIARTGSGIPSTKGLL